MLIGIGGKIGSGKDLLGELIVKDDPSFKIKKFGENLKRVCQIVTGFDDQWSQDGKSTYLPEWDKTVREIQQIVGTDLFRRHLNNDTWIISLLSKFSYQDNWVITDVRFPNEINSILDRGGKVVYIDRPNNPYPKSNHISELSFSNAVRKKYNIPTIINDGTPLELLTKFKKLYL